jgi:hypothetical protein
MATYEFTATHGVHFADDDGEWAAFERAPDLDTPEGAKRYRFVTDSLPVAKRLRGVDDYGITEVKQASRVSDNDDG